MPASFTDDSNVIASQRVRPEVADPMVNSAKQSRATNAGFWIASSPLGLLAMTSHLIEI
jgi:hypothetical protein